MSILDRLREIAGLPDTHDGRTEEEIFNDTEDAFNNGIEVGELDGMKRASEIANTAIAEAEGHPAYRIWRLAGRCADGAERDGGYRVSRGRPDQRRLLEGAVRRASGPPLRRLECTPRRRGHVPTVPEEAGETVMVTLVDCGCEARVHADGSGIEIDYCPLHSSAPRLLAALKAMRDGAYGNPGYPADNDRIDAEADAAIDEAEGR